MGKKFEMDGVSGNPRNPPKTAPGLKVLLCGFLFMKLDATTYGN